ncbi:MAG: GvpL/GvpF family gas vesicle protein [Actinobacteria bacterium]|nr:GvpL/GvpF family gas vesicle protein [Actinomycetota bacterium]
MRDEPSACYVYCVVPAAQVPPLDDLAGVDPGLPVGSLTAGELCAVTSRVRLAEFGEDALRRNLEDLAWVERTARAHDAVLARALSAGAVVPLRLCTIFGDADHVRAMLERERERLHDALERLRGRSEWSVKARADLRRPAPAESGGAAPEQTPGRAFFARKQGDRELRERAAARATAAAQEIHDGLRAEAVDALLLPPQDPALSGRSGTTLLNGAYLVERAREPAFTAAVAQLAARHRDGGVEVDVSGPWAPYNFVATEPQRDERRAAAPAQPA